MDELSLVEASRGGDRAAFGELVDRYYRSIYRFVYQYAGNHHDADDLCQQTFLHAVSNLDGLRDSDRFRAWIFTISMNLIRKRWRKLQRMRAISLQSERGDEAIVVESESGGPIAELSAKEKAGIVRERVGQMPEHMRDVVVLILMEGFAQKEAAVILGCSEATVSRHLNLAREWLHGRLKDVV